MNLKIKEQYEERAGIIKAIAHPSRLFIIEELAKNEMCVQDLTNLIGSDISTISKHLTILKNKGIVSNVRKGARIYYKLQTPCILNFIGCIEQVIEANVNKQVEILNTCKSCDKNEKRG